jgi:hypothetical protein
LGKKRASHSIPSEKMNFVVTRSTWPSLKEKEFNYQKAESVQTHYKNNNKNPKLTE